ncbi:MAG: tetratricopeptide repeat protein [Myxococcales bacterium]|nr:tetratricopeptide repeat protein [Myxococcales bacterium]
MTDTTTHQTTETSNKGQERELAELRREILESRNLIIKTDNLLKNLQAELRNVAKKGAEQYSRTWLATGVAYAVFAVMAIAIGVLATRVAVSAERGRVERAEAAMADAQKVAADVRSTLETQRQDAARQKAASVQAMSVYQQFSDGRSAARLKGVDAYMKLDRALLSELEKTALAARSRQILAEASEAALEKAKAAFRKQEMKAAAESFERYFALSPEGPEVSNAHFLAGAANFEIKDFGQAVPHLERFLVGGKAQRNHDYGTALLGQALEKLGQTDKALRVYEQGLKDYPSNSVMRNRRAALLKNSGAAAPSAPTSVVPAPQAPASPTRPAAALQPLNAVVKPAVAPAASTTPVKPSPPPPAPANAQP